MGGGWLKIERMVDGWMDGWGDGKKRIGETGIDKRACGVQDGKDTREISRARLIEGAP